MKVFISFPMNGKKYEDLVRERSVIIDLCSPYLSKDAEYIDTIMTDPGDNALYCLAKTLEALSGADLAVFSHGWEYARGCIIEHECAEKYGIPILEIK